MEHTTDIFLQFMGIILILLFLFIFTAKFIMNVYIPFINERDYIQMEIARSSGAERQRWQRALRRLYIGCIPVVGKYINRKNRQRQRK